MSLLASPTAALPAPGHDGAARHGTSGGKATEAQRVGSRGVNPLPGRWGGGSSGWLGRKIGGWKMWKMWKWLVQVGCFKIEIGGFEFRPNDVAGKCHGGTSFDGAVIWMRLSCERSTTSHGKTSI